MKIAIIGLPNSGKTTVFNALTGQTAETTAFSTGRCEPNIASVKVPDRRVNILAEIYRPRKVTRAEVQYVDIGGFSGTSEGSGGIPPEVLHYAGTADALLAVIRAFESDSLPHPAGGIDPRRDLESIELELILSDLGVAEKRLEKLEKEIRKMTGAEKTVLIREQAVLEKFQVHLENEQPLRNLDLGDEEEKLIRGFQFLSIKPLLVVFNIGENQIAEPPVPEITSSRCASVSFCAKIEEELVQLEEEDAREFMAELGITEAARDKVITRSYALLGLISFMTVGEDEVRAWTVREGTPAPEAGGVIHSDIQRGFIRAEVIPFRDLVEAGSLPAAKRKGRVRVEGRNYIIRDGEISHFLFNV